ncbi:PaaI family thioesterase [Acinetobacter radioresistens]|jgi:uncharacterized protein (TIGR00369 family)|uniref:Thioesterase domain-containing protein n=1 Tax=Acinetobacter radioresistens SK82 TaxID=596318 RepID=A0ABM9YKF1_ACIRA|nr:MULTISPECIES: PaaI family thioesterase [Acinetobacter]EET81392.1 hypothetical protein ACIRA0001_1310 [Acinetobacter radioresistens SK82]EEY86821.1 hypothetical protein HMPREF0018_01394 [Acinetobacter radioresistens SH164]ENV84527.1 hypothetical protein F940_02546 [Acinetobacter radioresistens NIPH 2130]EXB87326.1 hypothetical protein J538_0821 [Acinetobacter sp. 272263]EXE59045.1 hypothetical protein J579_0922 [Acinetobacter sp. 1239920]
MKDPKQMTGLELLTAMRDGVLPSASIGKTMPMQSVEVTQGTVTFKVKADERHLNPLGGVHGGFAATVLDSVTGCAVHSMLEAGAGYGTIDLNIKMCRPIPKNKELQATGTLINLSKNLGIAEGKIFDEKGKLYAFATATCMILRN